MAITIDTTDVGTPKRRIVESAFGRLGMAGYEFGRTAEEVSDALVLLNDMMAEEPFSAIAGWEPVTYGNGSADEGSGIPPADVGAVVAGLALRLAPAFGVTLSPSASAVLSRTVMSLRSRYADAPTMAVEAGTPRGAGWRRSAPFVPAAPSRIPDDYDPGNLAGLID